MVPRLCAGGEGEGLSCHTAAWGLRYAHAFGILNLKDTETPVNMALGQLHAVSTVLSLSMSYTVADSPEAQPSATVTVSTAKL